MANKRGQLNCTEDAKNTGFGSCFEDWKLMKGAILYDAPRTFTDDEISDLQNTLEADAWTDTKAERGFPMHDFRAATDGTEDPVIQTYDYGSKDIVRDGDNDWSFQFRDGGNCLQQSLRSHNGKRYAIFYDKENKILGYKKSGSFATIPLQFFYAYPWKLATGSTAAMYMVRFVFESKYANELRDFVKADFEVSDIKGLQDIDIIVNSWNQTTGVANVTMQTACGAVNLYDQYSANLAHTNNLKALDQDNNDVTVSAMTPVSASKTFNITLTPGDLPDSGTVTLSGSTVSQLATNGLEGYEIGKVNLEVEGS
jgi:hypothetical protein